MSSLKVTCMFAIVTVAIIAAAVASAASAASERSGKFVPPNWPDETIYRPDCQIVQTDGGWLPCVTAKR